MVELFVLTNYCFSFSYLLLGIFEDLSVPLKFCTVGKNFKILR